MVLGQVITFGRNHEGQLGRGNTRGGSNTMPRQVRGLGDRKAAFVECGASFTVCATLDNVLHFWGTRHISPITRPSTQDAFGTNFLTRINSADQEHGMSDSNLRHQGNIHLSDVVLEPQEMLALYSSDAQLGRGHTVMLQVQLFMILILFS